MGLALVKLVMPMVNHVFNLRQARRKFPRLSLWLTFDANQYYRMVLEVCFSAKTAQLQFIKDISYLLESSHGISSFYQEDILLIGPQWQGQWMKAAQRSSKIICLLDKEYLLSEPCCLEFGVAKNLKKLVTVYIDSPHVLSTIEATDFNGQVLMHVVNLAQGLPPNVDVVTREISKVLKPHKISAPLQVSTSPSLPPTLKVNESCRIELGTSMSASSQLLLSPKSKERAVAEEARTKYGPQALIESCKAGDVEAAKALLTSGEDINGPDLIARPHGWTPLLYACCKGHLKVVQLLLDNGADLDHADESGWTGLMWSVQNRHERIAEVLAKKGARTDLQEKIKGHTALDLASLNGSIKLVEMLLEAGASASNKTLECAKSRGHSHIVALLGGYRGLNLVGGLVRLDS